MQSPLTVPSEYQLESDHYLISYYSYYDETLGFTSYWNPFGYGFVSNGNSNGFQFLPNYGPTYVGYEFIYLGTTAVYYPVIPSLTITPFSSVMEGGSREVEVKMENLPFSGYAQVSLPSVASNRHATFDAGSYNIVVGNGTTKVTLKGTIKSDSVDDQKIRIAYGGVQSEELFSVVKLNLNNVSFSGPNYPVIKDESLIHEPFSAPHWKVGGALHEQNSPVCYKSGTSMKVFAEWSPSPDTSIDFPAPKIKGDGNGNLDFPDTATVINSGSSGNGVKINSNGSTATNPFTADTIDYFDPLMINWSISSQVPTATDSWNPAGVSKNPVYVLLNAPPTTLTYSDTSNPTLPPFSTPFRLKDAILYISCKNAKGLNGATPAGKDLILASIWNEFTDQKVETRPQYDLFSDSVITRSLYYYQNYKTAVTKPWALYVADRFGQPILQAGLIESGDGQCGSWALFLASCLRVQGLPQSMDYVFVRAINPSPQTTPGLGFFVKNWIFGQASGSPLFSGFPYRNLYYSNSRVGSNRWLGFTSYEWLPNMVDVSDASGVAGQGTQFNPASIFENHQFLRITSLSNVPTYYDGSYGVTYTSLLDFENKAIAGFYLNRNVDIGGVWTGWFAIKSRPPGLNVEWSNTYAIQ